MKCFYDPTQDAVGPCKSCDRGSSPDHLTDLGKGLACRGEDDVKALIVLIERNIAGSLTSETILKRVPRAVYGSGMFGVGWGCFSFLWE